MDKTLVLEFSSEHFTIANIFTATSKAVKLYVHSVSVCFTTSLFYTIWHTKGLSWEDPIITTTAAAPVWGQI